MEIVLGGGERIIVGVDVDATALARVVRALLEALQDPDHEYHAETLEWPGEDFDPNAFDAEYLKAGVAALAKRWARKPAARKP
jgi:hypothetical protein